VGCTGRPAESITPVGAEPGRPRPASSSDAGPDFVLSRPLTGVFHRPDPRRGRAIRARRGQDRGGRSGSWRARSRHGRRVLTSIGVADSAAGRRHYD